MHIPLTFQLIKIKSSTTLLNIPPNHPLHTIFKNQHNCHHSLTYPSYFRHLLTQLLLYHNSHTPNKSFPDYHHLNLADSIPSILAPSPLHLSSYKQHTLIILFLSASQTTPPLPLTLPIFHVPTRTPKRQSRLPSYCELYLCNPA